MIPINWRGVFLWMAIGLILVCLCVIGLSSAATNESVIASPSTGNWTTRTVYPGDTIYWNETVDFRIVSGWNHQVVNINNRGRQIDVSSWESHIFVDPRVFPVGTYEQWYPYDDPAANNLAFFVEAFNQTVALQNVSVANFTGVNETKVLEMVLPIERRQISDILIARGDYLKFEHPNVTADSRVWIFGTLEGVYDAPCEDGFVYVNSTRISWLSAGTYKLVVVNPGKNTIVEALYDPDEYLIYSPFINKPSLEVKGMGPIVVYDKFLDWITKNSDDVVLTFDMAVQNPYIEITSIDMQYYAIDSLHITGYTNLMNNSQVYVTIDEDNLTEHVLHPTRFYSNAYSLVIGEMRQFEIEAPFDEPNITKGQHTITARGNYGAWANVPYYIYLLPEGQEKPRTFIKYVGGYEFVPTPTPEIKIVREVVTQIVEKKIMIPVTPSDEQVKKAQDSALYDFVTGWAWRIGVLLLASVCALVGFKYLIGVIKRARL